MYRAAPHYREHLNSSATLFKWMMMMADFSQTRIWGRLMVSSCMLVGDCRVRFLKRTPYCTLDRRRFGLRTIGMLLALSASCVFTLRLQASLSRTYDWLFSLMSANCLGLRPPAAMTDGWFPPVQPVSSVGLCNAFLEHHDLRFSSWSSLKKTALGMHTSHILVTWPAQRSCTWSKWTLCWAGWLS